MMKIVFLDAATFPEWVPTEPSANWPEHSWQSYRQTTVDQVVERLNGADVAITNKAVITAEHMQSLPDLKLITVAATGYNNIDVEQATTQGVTVCNVQNYAEVALAEHALGLLFALSKNIKAYDRRVQAGDWQKSEMFCLYDRPVMDLAGKQLGIIGAGSLGMATANGARALGMKVVFSGHKNESPTKALARDRVPFEQVLKESHAISIHCPLTAETLDLIDAEAFTLMQKKPILINTARGGIVNESAAVDAIHSGQISSLGMDVLTKEPPTAENPLLGIAHLDNVIITPHVAWATTEAMKAVWQQTLDNIDGYFSSAPVRRINR